MKAKSVKRTLFAGAIAALNLFAPCAEAKTLFTVAADRPDCRYDVGETVTYTVTATDEKGTPLTDGKVSWSLDNFGSDVIAPRTEVDLAAGNPFRVTGKLPYPGFLRLNLNAADGSSRGWSVAVAPERVRVSSPRPADFDAFWDAAVARLAREVSLDPQVERVEEKSKGAFDYYEVSFATFGGRVYGFLTVPKDKSRKYPALVTVPGAGPYHNGSWYGSGDRVSLMMNVLPFKPNRDNAKFTADYETWSSSVVKKFGVRGPYGTAGIAASREDYVYYSVILGINRAVDWLAARPEVDTSRIGYYGGSQGGAFGYFLLGLNRNFTRGAMYVPAMADHLAARQKRLANWPQLLDAQPVAGRAEAERNAPYFDIAHFAPRIRVPVRSLVGLSDTTCPPAGGWCAFNALASKDKAMTTRPGMTHKTDPTLEWNLLVWASGTRPAAFSADGCGLVGGVQPVAAVTSPDGRNEIRLWNDPLAYAVVRDGVEIVAKGEISLKVAGADLRDLAKAKKPTVTRRAQTGAEPSPVYKKAKLDLAGAFAKADFGDWGVELAARDDGVAYRFYTAKSGQVVVADEKADVRIPSDAKCWYGETWRFGEEEAIPRSATFVSIGPVGTIIYPPFVAQVGGTTLAVTESDVYDYPILNFTKALDGAELEAKLAGFPKRTFNSNGKDDTGERRSRWVKVGEHEDFLVKTTGSRTFPWRVFLLADEPSRLCEADIVNALARPAAKGRDFSWVKPGKVEWEWWNDWDNKGWKGVTTANYKRFVDFAAKNGVEYILMDEGWSDSLNIWKFNPNVDVPEIIRYGKEKGVGVILWMAWAQVVGDEERVASHFAKLGAKGFKVDFMDRGDAEVERFLWTFAEACRRNKMLIDYHGAHRPTGMSRAYPNVVGYEGVHGLECMKDYKAGWGHFTANDVRACFLRMTAGPIDYTPGAMDNYPIGGYRGNRANPGSEGTRCRQVAMMVIYEAPLQMLCDAPTKYERNAECFAFMSKVPTTWAETKGLGGTPDTMFACARKAKDGAWYAAGMTNADARDFTLDTAFLGAGDWTAEIFRDAADADTEPTHYVRETKPVRAGEKIPFHMAKGGGFAVRFAKAAPSRVAADSAKEKVFAKLKAVAASPNYYWAWTYPWLDHGNWAGDTRLVVEKDGKFLPKPMDEVKLSCGLQKFTGGRRAVVNYADLASLVGTWHSDRYYRVNRAGMTAAIKRQWKEFGGVMVFNWHMDQPYCTNGFRAASYRFKSSGEDRNVVRQILDGTGGSCGTGAIDGKSVRAPAANPRAWFFAQLKDIADFFNGLVDEDGRKIPVILRYPHECDGSWFWWGRTWCTADEFRRLCRMEADYLREKCGPDQILFAYTPDRTWKDFGKEGDSENTFLAYYPGDAYVDIIGIDDYSIGNGNDEQVKANFDETVRKLRLLTAFADERGKVASISESGGNKKRDDFWGWLHRAATAEGVKIAFANTWAGEYGSLPATADSEKDERAFAARPQVLMEGSGLREVPLGVTR